MSESLLRIAIINDIHYGPDKGTKLCSRGKPLFARFAEWVGATAPDLCLDLGDRICSTDRESDMSLMAEVSQWFAALDVRRAHLLGNHDIDKLSAEENEQILGQSLRSQSIELKGWRLILWSVSAALDKERGFSAKDDELEWLGRELARSSAPTVIFTHVPLDNGAIEGNYYFERAFPHHAGYPAEQGRSIRALIEQAGCVALCINGHAHWNAYHAIDGIHYVTVPSLTEAFPTYPEPCESWTSLTLSPARIRIEVFGKLPVVYELAVKQPLDRHWLNMDKPYAPQVVLPN